jgi:hypothetical protein
MADINLKQSEQLPQETVIKYKDMGDGTYAKVYSADISDRIGRLVGRVSNYDVLVNGTLAALNDTVEIDTSGLSTCGLGISGTWAGTIVAEVTVGDGVWDTVPLIDQLLGSATVSTIANGNWLLGIAGSLRLRIRASAWTSGTATIYLEGSSVASGTFLSRSIPTGGNLIGSILAAAGENHIGQIGGEGITISQTPTVTAGVYSANDAVGGLLTFASAARVSGGGGIIKQVVLLDDAGQDAAMELWLFNSTFTAMADNAAWAPSEADLRKLIAIVSTADGAYFAAGTPSAARVVVDQRYDLTGTSMFGQLVTRGTPTFVATDDVTVKVCLVQD